MVVGLECEYGFYVTNGGIPASSVLTRAMPGTGQKQWQLNGGRLYMDVGSHPEFATPECRNAVEAVIYDRAGEQILIDRLRRERVNSNQTKHLVKNNYARHDGDSPPYISYGTHENYRIPKECSVTELMERLEAFYVTRQVWAGSGISSDNGMSGVGQRSFFFKNAHPVNTQTNNRSFVAVRAHEPHDDINRYWRLQLLVGDSNILFKPAWLKVATMNLMVEMLATSLLPDIRLVDPLRAIVSVSRHPHSAVETSQGLMTPIEIQQAYLAQAELYADKHERVGLRGMLRAWSTLLANLGAESSELYGQVDWYTKGIIEQDQELRHGKERAAAVDLAYHDLLGRLPWKVRARFDPPWLQQRVTAAVAVPPPTRARMRSRFIAATKGLNNLDIDWTYVGYSINGGSPRFQMQDPLQTHKSGFELFVRSVKRPRLRVIDRRRALP